MSLRRVIGGDIIRSIVHWLLRDDFNDTRAAGAVNGTDATPGPGGPRVVTDTESKLSLTGGNAVFSGGKAAPAWGDPAIWWAAQTRAAGLTLFTTVTGTKVWYSEAGFDADQAGTLTVFGIEFRDGPALYVRGATLGPKIIAVSNDTEYRLALVLRATGGFVFIKGGAFTQWTLLSVYDTGATAILYPAIGNYSASNLVVPFARLVQLPDALIPRAKLADSFTGTTAASDGVLNNGDTGEGAGIAHLGANWAIAGGNAANTPTPGAELLANWDFDAWTGDDPDDWTVTGEVGADPEVSEVGTGEGHGGVGTGMANFYSSATNANPKTTQTILTIGEWYVFEGVVDHWVAGAVQAVDASGSAFVSYGSVGTFRSTRHAINTIFHLRGGTAPTNVTMASISVKNIPYTELIGAPATWAAPDITSGLWRAGMTVAEGFQAGFIILCDDLLNPTTGFVCYYDQTWNRVKVFDIRSGGGGEVVSVAAAHSAGAVLEARLIGTKLTVWYNNVWLAEVTVNLTGAGTQYHLFSTDSTNAMHFFEAMDATELDYDRYIQ